MIVTRYSYNVPELRGCHGCSPALAGRRRRVLADGTEAPRDPEGGKKILIVIGGAFLVGLLGIAYLEWSQGWRPFGRTRRPWAT